MIPKEKGNRERKKSLPYPRKAGDLDKALLPPATSGVEFFEKWEGFRKGKPQSAHNHTNGKNSLPDFSSPIPRLTLVHSLLLIR